MSSKILILNGPNLNMLGVREPEIYGRDTLEDLRELCERRAAELDLEVDFRQSNAEGELVDWAQGARGAFAGIIINAGALTHTSIALLDALLACELPVIEVHLSNIFRREPYRRHSYVSEAAHGLICGLGVQGYAFALEAHRKLIDAAAS
jgi:3-dehydroquinate dehydratase-2